MLKISFQINEINLKDMDVLRNQLIGVDQAYMLQIINALKKAPTNTDIDSTYVAKIIDEVFN